MMQLRAKLKRATVVLAASTALIVTGAINQVHAFSFGEGDLVLAIYGNNTEALYNLGVANTILQPGGAGVTNFNASAGLTAALVGDPVGGPTNVRFTVFAWDSTGAAGMVHAGTTFAPGSINAAQVQLTNQFNPSAAWSFNSTFAGDTIAKSDSRSFSFNLNTSGAGRFEGAWPVAMQGLPGDVLNILKGNVDTNTFTQVGRVLLTANGFLTAGNPGPAPIPIPAAAVLFGTGLIGLVGVARRSRGHRPTPA